MKNNSPETTLVSLFEKLILEHGSASVQEKWNSFLKEKIQHLENENFALRAKLKAANARLQEKEKNSFGHLPSYLDATDFDHFARFGRYKAGMTITEYALNTQQRECDAEAEIEEYLDWGVLDVVENDGKKTFKINAFGSAYLRHLYEIEYGN